MAPVGRRIYLDHNATAPLLPEARAALLAALDQVGNPSSVHAEGRAARALAETARRNVASLVGASAEAVTFTASATESAMTVLTPEWYRDGAEDRRTALAVLATDHPALREGGRFAPDDVTRLPVDATGVINLGALDAWLARLDGAPALLALCLANGETGVLQPLAAIRERLEGRDVLLVLDVVQAVGRLSFDIGASGAAAVILSGHKLGAAKGVGALILADDGLRPARLVAGGGQEKGLRSGTEALPAIASLGAAALVAAARADAGTARLGALRDRIVARLEAAGCRFTWLGAAASRLDNTLALAIPGLKAESAQIALDLEGFAVSAGSACSSGKVGPSHVLAAMVDGGAAAERDGGLLRVSLGFETSEEDVEAFAAALAGIVARAQARDLARRAA
ncbi:cysteine desulfurase [Aureimonas endophytica]|uniref:Cysteine desulfurase n=1 Tax=Aureimonas endophytica TaxID=2027858 RepID=A0A916ZCT0_9HYPH|nr:cysteine desulfurase family protein [Aureimonas endophytica]GGD88638.1 cysteine desulfurase [Aureimonas endophytica]